MKMGFDHIVPLGYATPDHVYHAGAGGGALIVDKFSNDLLTLRG